MSGLLAPSSPGSNPGRTRAYNRRLVLRHVRAGGASGRAEIARLTGLSIQAVSNITGELLSDGWLRESGRRSEGRGQPAKQYVLEPSGGYALGLELRPDALLIALVDLNGAARFTHRETLDDASPGAVDGQVRHLRDMALKTSGIDASRLIGAGVVMPGPFGETGLSGAASDLPDAWGALDAAAWFEAALGVPTLIENDANAAATGERMWGVAKGLGSYAFVYFGRELGLGVVANGGLLRGARGNAGEIGHMPVQANGRLVPLEDIVSRLALSRRLVAASDSEAIATLHAAEDPILLQWIVEGALALGQAIRTIENLFDPETIIVGGAMPDGVLDDLIARVPLSEASVTHHAMRTVPRLLRGASGRLTATLGGAALVLDRAFTPHLNSADI